MSSFRFEEIHRSRTSSARRGIFHTPRGPVETPAFMPVGTKATVKAMWPEQLETLGARIVLANTYHLNLRPGPEIVQALGGLHAMMAWHGPILTDSGGFQVFSLADMAKVDEDGVSFRSEVDGSLVRLDAERALEIQSALGSDIAMVFDQCPTSVDDRSEVERAVERTLRWAARARAWHGERGGAARGQAVFGIVQGGAFEDLRRACARELVAMDFDGYAVGGVCVGEGKEAMHLGMEHGAAELPAEKVRYLMGIGAPEDFFPAVRAGIDLFDCVSPTRLGRIAIAFTSRGRVRVKNARFARDRGPLDPACACTVCARWSVGTLRHLFQAEEMLAGMLLSYHNLHFLLDQMRRIREAIAVDRLDELEADFHSRYGAAAAAEEPA
ncbi:MAG: tRNA guanosine(34) transglycosylase Tgt [Planctomycetes bacterium]|nr:tRNA guanosine(34) transglycosylase Tgt [Planctomycetota bacterium]